MPQKAHKIPQKSPNYNMILPLPDPVFDKLEICKVDHSPFVCFLKIVEGVMTTLLHLKELFQKIKRVFIVFLNILIVFYLKTKLRRHKLMLIAYHTFRCQNLHLIPSLIPSEKPKAFQCNSALSCLLSKYQYINAKGNFKGNFKKSKLFEHFTKTTFLANFTVNLEIVWRFWIFLEENWKIFLNWRL